MLMTSTDLERGCPVHRATSVAGPWVIRRRDPPCSVAATNRRETADLDIPELACSARLPTGSSPWW
jgi:hypothetical protein